MSEKIKAIRGSEERAEDVKQWLKNNGAIDFGDLDFTDNNVVFFVRPHGGVGILFKNYSFLFDVVDLPHWRANYSETYYYISDCGKIASKREFTDSIDNERYRISNYFKTQSEAKEVCSKIVKLLKERE